MQNIDKLAHAVKVVALCLPPVVMSLIGLAALSRKKGGSMVAAASSRPSSARGETQRQRMTPRPAAYPMPFEPGKPVGNVYYGACS